MTKQRGLGKGLGALLGEAAMQTAQPPSGAQLLPLQKVEPNPLQPESSVGGWLGAGAAALLEASSGAT